jgi:hypothetical protein
MTIQRQKAGGPIKWEKDCQAALDKSKQAMTVMIVPFFFPRLFVTKAFAGMF